MNENLEWIQDSLRRIETKTTEMDCKIDKIVARNGCQDTQIAVHSEKISSLEKEYFDIKSHAWKVVGWILGPTGVLGLIVFFLKTYLSGGGK